MEPRKQAIIEALRAFVRQRPGMDPRDYDRAGYLSESRRVTQDRHHAETLLAAVAGNDGITADMIVTASRSAYSGRLSLLGATAEEFDRTVRVGYCTGQYFPTEYRRAVAAVCASALWYYVREHAMPEPYDWEDTPDGGRTNCRYSWAPGQRESFLRAGDWLRAYFRREFGRTITGRYFQ